LGFSQVIDPGAEDNLVQTIHFYTNGIGTDIMYLCAGIKDSTITNDALACCRDRGRVIMIGDMGLSLDRAPLFQKELDFKISRSYGPGRYDKNYEEKGMDYPVGYVRWTEQRNLSLFLEMLQRGEVVVDKMVSAEFPVESAPEAYRSLVEEGERTLAVLLTYPEHKPEPYELSSAPRISLQKIKKKELLIGVIGCGSFVQANLLPHFRSLSARLYGVANRTPKDFSALRAIYSPDVFTTSVDQLINDPDVDAFIIATPHDSHAHLAKAVLEKGKPVHVEKPLALTLDEAEMLAEVVREKEGILTIGFNRRLSPSIKALRKALSPSPAPRQFLYRINAPVMPADHWTLDPEIGGGRLIGEGCHFIDLICYLANSEVLKVVGGFLGSESSILPSRDNFAITICFANGDIGTIVYSGQGNANLSKERIEVFVAGRVVVIDDFKSLEGYGISMPVLELKRPDKGFRGHLENFFSAVRGESELITTVDDWLKIARIIERVVGSKNYEEQGV
jgi:predicted dehydrogenase